MRQLLDEVQQGKTLTRDEMRQLIETFFEPNTSQTDMRDFLLALHARGETAEELAGAVDALMARATSYPTVSVPLLDTCGTGGDQSGTFNVSTTSAFVLAGAGLTVAKHGNRSISSRSGSSDVLAALGLTLSLSPEESAEQLTSQGLAFLFAPDVHPALKQLQPLRKAIGQPTLFNLIGPLANPYSLDCQLIGVYRQDMQQTLAQAAHLLGRRRAIIVTGHGELDEASLEGATHYTLLHEGSITTHTLAVEETGLPTYTRPDILGGDAETNARILEDVLDGKPSAYLDTTLLNAGLALFAAERVPSVHHGIEIARHSIQSGSAKAKLTNYPKLVEVSP
ncbi:anthranilate phosphoribosyltransferase [Chryseomicrobium palamuruense]|uniref:Anthranilate phosphoribosyltransferase n=1 Tax=Chryseomicrobium palamuruense TaxID=682973 RepID=A0ABV8UWP1_9BACL